MTRISCTSPIDYGLSNYKDNAYYISLRKTKTLNSTPRPLHSLLHSRHPGLCHSPIGLPVLLLFCLVKIDHHH